MTPAALLELKNHGPFISNRLLFTLHFISAILSRHFHSSIRVHGVSSGQSRHSVCSRVGLSASIFARNMVVTSKKKKYCARFDHCSSARFVFRTSN